jgi:hypothetical protein
MYEGRTVVYELRSKTRSPGWSHPRYETFRNETRCGATGLWGTVQTVTISNPGAMPNSERSSAEDERSAVRKCPKGSVIKSRRCGYKWRGGSSVAKSDSAADARWW